MKVEKRTPQVGDVVMLGSPTIRPRYLNGSLWEVIDGDPRSGEYECKLIQFQGSAPRNGRFWPGCRSYLRPLWLVGVVTEQDETVAAA